MTRSNTPLFPLYFAASLFEICCSRDSQTVSQTCFLMSVQHLMVRLQCAYLNLTLWNGSAWQREEEKPFPIFNTLSPFLGKFCVHSQLKKFLILSQDCLQIFSLDNFIQSRETTVQGGHVIIVLFVLLLKIILLERSNWIQNFHTVLLVYQLHHAFTYPIPSNIQPAGRGLFLHLKWMLANV